MERSSQLTQPVAIRLYVLRLWQNAATEPWRASLRPVAQDAGVHFADIDTLCSFLRGLAATAGAVQDSEEKPT